MNLLCPSCNIMPLIKITFIKKGTVLVIIRCKCGKKFHDLSTFISEYIIKQENEENSSINENTVAENKPLYFCETCFINIYTKEEINTEHKDHKLINIDKDNLNIITEEEFNSISINIKKATEKINDYLPKMRDMQNSIYINNLLLEFLWLVFNLYEKNKKQNTLTYQLIYNLKQNSDYNLNKYKLDIKNIKRERFISYLKSVLILCCNSYINNIYTNLIKDKDELLKLIFRIKPLERETGDKAQLEVEEIMKSNSSLYYGEKNQINHLAYGRGLLICSNGSQKMEINSKDIG